MIFGWLSPEGKMYECPYYGHIGLAYDLVEEYKIDKHRLFADYDISAEDDMLLFTGWVKIGKDQSTNGYAVIPPEAGSCGLKVRIAKVTEEQKRYLKHMYDEEPDKFSGIWLSWMGEIGVI